MTLYSILSLILVATGLVLLAVVAYLARLVRRHRRLLGTLLQLAQHSLDPLKLPAAAWPSLAEGGIRRLDYSGSWFGQPVQGSFGVAHDGSRPFTFSIVSGCDVSLNFRLYSGSDRGEARLFAENLAGVFRLLIETSIHSKMEALSAALAEQARLTLYLQHDLRNLAQWVEWLATDFAEAQDDAALLGVARRICTSAPHAAARARHILDSTGKSRSSPPSQSVSLSNIVREAADHAGITVTIDQDARVYLRRDLLERTLDNLFTNVAPLLRSRPGLSIAVTIARDEEKVMARIKMPCLDEIARLPPENLFEPFASGRPGGLGLGLYQARQSLKEAGGDLLAELHEREICFLLALPGCEW